MFADPFPCFGWTPWWRRGNASTSGSTSGGVSGGVSGGTWTRGGSGAVAHGLAGSPQEVHGPVEVLAEALGEDKAVVVEASYRKL